MAFKGLDMAFSDLRKGLGVLQVLSGESYSASFDAPVLSKALDLPQGLSGGSCRARESRGVLKDIKRLIRPLSAL
jgi:hypothetical protein